MIFMQTKSDWLYSLCLKIVHNKTEQGVVIRDKLYVLVWTFETLENHYKANAMTR